MLESLSLASFKGFPSAELPLRPFTMLIGPNGVGKSSVLQAIALLAGVVQGSLAEFLRDQEWDYEDLPHLRARSLRLGVTATVRLGKSLVRWELQCGTRKHPGIAAERVVRLGNAGTETLLLERDGRKMSRLEENTGKPERIEQTLGGSWLGSLRAPDRRRFPTLLELAEWARGIHPYLMLDPLRLRAPGRGAADDIGAHGEQLATFLAGLRQRDPKAIPRLIKRVRAHYPNLIRIDPRRAQYGWTRLEVTERWNGGRSSLNARQVSDGLLRLIAVAAMAELPAPPRLLLIDEVENGMHPHLLGGLIGLLQSFVDRSGGKTQVMATTHSPIALNYCRDAGGVLLVSRRRGRKPRFLPLDRGKGFATLRRHFDLGELWYNVGEERLQ